LLFVWFGEKQILKLDSKQEQLIRNYLDLQPAPFGDDTDRPPNGWHDLNCRPSLRHVVYVWQFVYG
jgi:hypothetical protein